MKTCMSNNFDTAKNTRDEDGINCLIGMPQFGEASMHPPDVCKMDLFFCIDHNSSILIPTPHGRWSNSKPVAFGRSDAVLWPSTQHTHVKIWVNGYFCCRSNTHPWASSFQTRPRHWWVASCRAAEAIHGICDCDIGPLECHCPGHRVSGGRWRRWCGLTWRQGVSRFEIVCSKKSELETAFFALDILRMGNWGWARFSKWPIGPTNGAFFGFFSRF